MKKRIPTFLATMIASALYSQQGLAADLASQCMLGVPSYDRPLVKGETNELPVTINADHAKGNYPDDAVMSISTRVTVACKLTRCNSIKKRRQASRNRCVPSMRSATSIMTTIRLF